MNIKHSAEMKYFWQYRVYGAMKSSPETGVKFQS